MPQDLTGNPYPVALLADPWARQFATASQIGDLPTTPNHANPLDLLDPSVATNGFALFILNSLATPLTLVENYEYWPANAGSNFSHGAQFFYPAVSDGVNPATAPHVIPPARPYPRHEKHPRAQGGDALMGGVGVYGFTQNMWSDPNTFQRIPHVQRALSFSADPDGTSGPLVAVTFRTKVHQDWTNPWVTTHSAVTADLYAKYTGLDDFYAKTMGADDGLDSGNDPATILYDIGAQYTVWACFAKAASAKSVPGYALTFWVRDLASTLGL